MRWRSRKNSIKSLIVSAPYYEPDPAPARRSHEDVYIRLRNLILHQVACSHWNEPSVQSAMLEVYLTLTKSELKCWSWQLLCRDIRRLECNSTHKQFAGICQFTTLQSSDILCLQRGGDNCCKQNDVTVTPYM